MKIITLSLKKPEGAVEKTIGVLKNGGLVIFPSDTVYGALVDAKNHAAVEKLIAFKSRPPGKPISVFLPAVSSLASYVKVNMKQSDILKAILPGPFTVILFSRHRVDRLLESENGGLGVRVPDYKPIESLAEKFGKPITATSANKSGKSPHYSVKTLLNDLTEGQKGLVDLVVDAGTLPRNKPSTVVDLTEARLKVLRQGDKLPGSRKFVSKSPEETKKIARRVLEENLTKAKPLVFIIEGELGVGKTIFVKGLGDYLGIKRIVSPTFVVYYEYGNFYHFDLYQVKDKEELKRLKIEKMLMPGRILCFEWGEKIGEIYDMVKDKSKVVYIKMEYIKEEEREIIVKL